MAKVKALLPNGQEAILEVTEVTLLSADEAAKGTPKRTLKRLLKLKNRGGWWLCSPGLFDFDAACVRDDAACVRGDYGNVDSLGCPVRDTLGVRPALRVKDLSSLNLKTGAVVSINGRDYYVIPGDTLLSKECIGECSFREDWRAADANNYEASDVKKFVDNWAVKQGFKEATDVKEVANDK